MGTAANVIKGGDKAPDELALVMDLMPPKAGERVLDVGCGYGGLGFFLKEKEPSIEMVFSDILPELAAHFPTERFVACSMESMPFPDGYFDKLFCLYVVAHLTDPEKALLEARRVLKKGGKLMLITPNVWYVRLMLGMSFLRLIPPFAYDSNFRQLYSKGTLHRALRGFARVRVSYFRNAPRFLPLTLFRQKLVAIAER